MNKGFHWDFEVLDESEYRMVLTYQAANSTFKRMLKMTKRKLEKKKVNVPEGVLEQFTLPESQKKYLIPVLTRATKKNVKFVMNEVKKDGITALNGKVIDAFYNKKDSGDWEIKVFVKGVYRQ